MNRSVSPWLKSLSVAASSATFALVALGGIVRVSEAGLACPDWPLCYGQIIPPLEVPVLLEYFHRLLASIVSVLVFAVAALSWLRYRSRPAIFFGASAAAVLLAFQVVLGGLTVLLLNSGAIVAAHLATALALLAALLVVTTAAFATPKLGGAADGIEREEKGLRPLALVTALATYGLILIGSYVTASGADDACPNWPLCNGGLFPEGRLAEIHFLHRLVAVGVGVLLIALVIGAWRRRHRQRVVASAALLALGFYLAQVMVGGINVLLHLPAALGAVHLALAAALWATLVVLVTAISGWAEAVRDRAGLTREVVQHWQPVVKDYIALTKPRIILLLLVTCVPTMVIAAKGIPPLWLMVATLAGGALAAGSANALNCYIDRDIDRLMTRTRNRPLPAGRMAPGEALAFGIALAGLAFVELAAFVNLLSALLGLGAIAFYVLVYTLWLKRSTPQNIVIGGAAGAVPPLVAWAAVTNSIGLPAIILFAIVFYWTPPHFWALALSSVSDYRRAGVPMLPVVRGEQETKRQILLYSLILVWVTLLLFPLHVVGYIYLGAAALLGARLLVLAFRLLRQSAQRAAPSLFRYSIAYLALLFAAMVVDQMIRL